jgi:hypothetical protein
VDLAASRDLGHPLDPMQPSPDPVSAPDAYRQLLLAALGADDPADALASTPAALRALVGDAGADLAVRPEAREWSALECIGHMVDAELVTAARSRWILAEDEPDIVPYDQDLWVGRLQHGEDDAGELLDLFEALRRAGLALWTRTPESDRDRAGIHRERGRESYGLTIRLLAGHDRIHLAQARAAIEAVRSR